MSRIESRLSSLANAGRKALIPFITAGDPEPQVTVPLLHELVTAGADLLEIGVPFSDPMADGPVIQRASERALAHGVTLHGVLDMVQAFRATDADTPVILMGYLNPIEVFGYEAFAKAAAAAGVDGILTVDVPPEEATPLADALREAGLDPIFLLAPTSGPERIERICALASGFVYYVSFKGVTGSASLDLDAIAAKLEQIREVTRLPLGGGFGISDAERAAAVAQVADAVIVGSALVRQIEVYPGDIRAATAAMTELLGSMRTAIDAVAARAVEA
jgi:tryptophan synthase alpha chain